MMNAAPIIAAAAIKKIGLKRIARLQEALTQERLLATPAANEIHEQDRIAHDNAGKRDEADQSRGREGRSHEPLAQHDSDEGQRHRDKDHEQQVARAVVTRETLCSSSEDAKPAGGAVASGASSGTGFRSRSAIDNISRPRCLIS